MEKYIEYCEEDIKVQTEKENKDKVVLGLYLVSVAYGLEHLKS